MKKIILLLGLFIGFILNCDMNYRQPGDSQEPHYQTRTGDDQTNPGSVSGRAVYIAAGTVKNEYGAIQEAQKLERYGIQTQVFYVDPKQGYVIVTGTAEDWDSAQRIKQEQVARGIISSRAKLTDGKGWRGPVYVTQVSTPSPAYGSGTNYGTTPGYNTDPNYGSGTTYDPGTNPAPGSQYGGVTPDGAGSSYSSNPPSYPTTPSDTPIDNYLNPNDPNAGRGSGAYGGNTQTGTGLYYLVLVEARNENQAIEYANQFIRQGLVIYVYETTRGFAVTLGNQAKTQQQAETERQSLIREGKIRNATLVPDGPFWQRLIYP